MADKIPWITLNSGHKMPVLGFGTATMNLPDQENLVLILLDAIRLGYRSFDTAAVYGTEKQLGLAVKEALRLGIVKSRDELFITSKLWIGDSHPELVLPALKKSLSNLGIKYLDLYLIHWPMSMKPQEASMHAIRPEDTLPIDMAGVWKAMEECQKLGLTRSIGVSNFSSKKLADLLSCSTIPPAVNQVEMNISWDQRKLRDFCENNNGIKIEAWAALGASGEVWGSNKVMQNPTMKQIALVKGKTLAQIVGPTWNWRLSGSVHHTSSPRLGFSPAWCRGKEHKWDKNDAIWDQAESNEETTHNRKSLCSRLEASYSRCGAFGGLAWSSFPR